MFERIRLWHAKTMMCFWSEFKRAWRSMPHYDYEHVILMERINEYADKKWSKWSKRYCDLLFGGEDWYTKFKEES